MNTKQFLTDIRRHGKSIFNSPIRSVVCNNLIRYLGYYISLQYPPLYAKHLLDDLFADDNALCIAFDATIKNKEFAAPFLLYHVELDGDKDWASLSKNPHGKLVAKINKARTSMKINMQKLGISQPGWIIVSYKIYTETFYALITDVGADLILASKPKRKPSFDDLKYELLDQQMQSGIVNRINYCIENIGLNIIGLPYYCGNTERRYINGILPDGLGAFDKPCYLYVYETYKDVVRLPDGVDNTEYALRCARKLSAQLRNNINHVLSICFMSNYINGRSLLVDVKIKVVGI